MKAVQDPASQNLRMLGERIRARRTTKLFLKQKVSKKLLRDAIEVGRHGKPLPSKVDPAIVRPKPTRHLGCRH